MALPTYPQRHGELVQLVNWALTEAERKSGDWLKCRPGCTQCCYGVFAIDQLDALRLRHGMEELARREPVRAQAVRQRARESWSRMQADFPGQVKAGLLATDMASQAEFEEFGNDEPCPALSAEGTCDVYEFRPMTCRVFGPPVRSGDEGGLGVCELCYNDATAEQIAECEMRPDPDNLAGQLNREVERTSRVRGETIVAFVLAH